MNMFDELHDPDPPEFGADHFRAVTARAKSLRRRRHALAVGVCAIVLGLGGGAVALTVGDDAGEIAPITEPTKVSLSVEPTTAPPTEPSTGATEPTVTQTDPSVEATAPELEALTMRLKLETEVVVPGGRIASTLVIENETDETIVDVGCNIPGGRWGLVPRAQPDADLSHFVIVDCSNEGYPFEPGSREVREGPMFEAADRPGGDPLEPGEYFAAVEISDRSQRLLVPVVVEGRPITTAPGVDGRRG